MTAITEPRAVDGAAAELTDRFLRWLESGVRPEGMFAPDVLADLTIPHWRLQARGEDGAFRLREDQHPATGTVRVEALDRTSRGFLVQIEERWAADGQRWYCRELIHAVVVDGRIAELAIYCTGDWDEDVQRRHAAQVRLLRP